MPTHTTSYPGRVPHGPEPELVETPFGMAVVYANEDGNVVAQTADPAHPLTHGGHGFDVAVEVFWDGYGTRMGPRQLVLGPEGQGADTLANAIIDHLAGLAVPYAERHERAIIDLIIHDIAVRLRDIRARQKELSRRMDDNLEARHMEPVERELPIGPVAVSFVDANSFQILGLGYGGTVNVDGRRFRYKATVPTTEGGAPFVSLLSLGDPGKGMLGDEAHKAMVAELGRELRTTFAKEIA